MSSNNVLKAMQLSEDYAALEHFYLTYSDSLEKSIFNIDMDTGERAKKLIEQLNEISLEAMAEATKQVKSYQYGR